MTNSDEGRDRTQDRDAGNGCIEAERTVSQEQMF